MVLQASSTCLLVEPGQTVPTDGIRGSCTVSLLDTIDDSTGDASLTSMVAPAAFVSEGRAGCAVCISTFYVTTILLVLEGLLQRWGGGCGSPRGQRKWQRQFWGGLIGVSPPGGCCQSHPTACWLQCCRFVVFGGKYYCLNDCTQEVLIIELWLPEKIGRAHV